MVLPIVANGLPTSEQQNPMAPFDVGLKKHNHEGSLNISECTLMGKMRLRMQGNLLTHLCQWMLNCLEVKLLNTTAAGSIQASKD